jgi:hypothetical protein
MQHLQKPKQYILEQEPVENHTPDHEAMDARIHQILLLSTQSKDW